MELKESLLELKKLMRKWGISENDWALILHFSDILQGYDLEYPRDKHLHIVISDKKIP